MSGAADLLSIDDLTAVYDAHDGRTVAVDGVSLRVGQGEAVGLVGESGSGKTTTVLSVLRLLGPRGRIVAGRVEFESRDLLALNRSEMRQVRGAGIAAIPQDAANALNPVLTVGEQIAESLRTHLHLSRRAARSRAEELLAAVSMPRPAERLGDYPHQLSGGMQRRALIAIAIACDPRLLIADEPTAALDGPTQVQILQLIEGLSERLEMSMLLVTHDLAVAADACARIAVMYAGRIVETIPTDAMVRDGARHPYTRDLLAAARGVHERELNGLSDRSPDREQASSGCPFASSCPHASEACRRARPPVTHLSDRHCVRCWREEVAHDS